MSAQTIYIPNLSGGQAIELVQMDDEYSIQALSLSASGLTLERRAGTGFPVNYGRSGSSSSSSLLTTAVVASGPDQDLVAQELRDDAALPAYEHDHDHEEDADEDEPEEERDEEDAGPQVGHEVPHRVEEHRRAETAEPKLPLPVPPPPLPLDRCHVSEGS